MVAVTGDEGVFEHLPVDVESNIGKVNWNWIMVPFIVTNLTQFPSPLGWFKDGVFALKKWLLTQQENQATISNEQRVVVTIFFCLTLLGVKDDVVRGE